MRYNIIGKSEDDSVAYHSMSSQANTLEDANKIKEKFEAIPGMKVIITDNIPKDKTKLK